MWLKLLIVQMYTKAPNKNINWIPNPKVGAVIQGTGGLRKVRVAAKGNN